MGITSKNEINEISVDFEAEPELDATGFCFL